MILTRNTAAGPVTVAGPILTTRAGPVDARRVIVTKHIVCPGYGRLRQFQPRHKNKTKKKKVPDGGISTSADLGNVVS